MAARKQGLVIVGGGPAGLAPLFAAGSSGRLQELLDRGVTILERSGTLGSGDLGHYAIGSDSSAEALLDIVAGSKEPRLRYLGSHPITCAVAQCGQGAVPLALAGEFLRLAGAALCEAVVASKRGAVLRGATAQYTQQIAGGWRTIFLDSNGGSHAVDSQNVLLASGAHQPEQRLRTEIVAGAPLWPAYGAKLMQSGEVLRPTGLAMAAHRLRGRSRPRVCVVGGSTSAAAVANALLTRLPEVAFGERGITMLHRRPVRIFYETASEAVADGYNDFSAQDICPITGRVNRLSGFRLDSKALMLRACGVGGRSPETRFELLRLRPEAHRIAQERMRASDLVVAALGYRPRLLPVFDSALRPIALRKPEGDRWAVVDEGCRVLREDSWPLAGLFAMGLAVGPSADRQLGGERGFTGQVNSLWLWQHTLGLRIVEQVCGDVHGVRCVPLPGSSSSSSTSLFPLAAVRESELAGAA